MPGMEGIRNSGLTGKLSFAIMAGAFGSAFQHGYNTGVVNAPQKLIMDWIQNCRNIERGSGLKPEWVCDMAKYEVTIIWAVIVAIFCVGGMIGGSAVGVVSSKLGRKNGLLLNNILMFIAGICMLIAKWIGSFEILIVGRFIIGINSGLNAGLAPMYLSEIAPVSLRGAVGTVYQLIITISILLSQILGVNEILGNASGWPWLLGLTILPGIFQVVTLPFCPESPKYLLMDKNDPDKARSAMVWFRGREDVNVEMEVLRIEQETVKATPKVTLKEMLTNSSLRKPLFIAVMMMLAQQLSGINAAIFYSTSIFLSSGLSVFESQIATLIMGAMNVGMTVISLLMIEKAGRKTLMIVGLAIMAFTTTLLLICLIAASAAPFLAYVAVAMVVLFVVGFATGPGSIPWFFVTELFNQSGRPIATSIAVATNWGANFLVGLFFAPLQLAIGPYVFIIFMVIQVFFIVYIFFQVPETKNRTIEEITAQFR